MPTVKELFYKVFQKILIQLFNIALHSHKLTRFGLWLIEDCPWIKAQLLKLIVLTHSATIISTDNTDSMKSIGQLPETAREIYVLLYERYKSRGITL